MNRVYRQWSRGSVNRVDWQWSAPLVKAVGSSLRSTVANAEERTHIRGPPSAPARVVVPFHAHRAHRAHRFSLEQAQV